MSDSACRYFSASSVVPGVADSHPLDSPRLSADKTLTALGEVFRDHAHSATEMIALLHMESCGGAVC